MGSDTNYQYARGWVLNEVIAEQPDLILTYTNGTPESLEAMLRDIRSHTTANVIVPSLHLLSNEKLTEESINKPVWDQVRQVCQRSGAQFVDNRRELAAWLRENDKEPTDLLADVVHQNELGRLLINENIARHFVRSERPGHDPAERERRLSVIGALAAGEGPVALSGEWKTHKGGLASSSEGAQMEVSFTGSRIDLIGVKQPNGGSAQVRVDGQPADKVPAFHATYVRPAIANIGHMGQYPRHSGGNRDTGPHGVILGTHLRSQTWTIRMLNGQGDCELVGSKTQRDGQGNSREPFTSDSGQIIIDPSLWRHPQANREGDEWTFEVYRCATGRVSFNSEAGEAEAFSVPLVQNLPNGPHVLEVVVDGTGPVTVDSFYVFEPPLRPEARPAS